MTREEFIHKIDNTTTGDLINAFFEYMALFNLCSDECGSNVYLVKSSSEPISFKLICEDENCANRIYSTLNGGGRVIMYDIAYNIHCVLDGNLINLYITTQSDMG